MEIIKFVDIGEGITEGNVVKLNHADGDNVKEDETIMEIETDKAVVNIPTPLEGTIKYAVANGAQVKPGDALAVVGAKDEVSSYKFGASVQNEGQRADAESKNKPSATPANQMSAAPNTATAASPSTPQNTDDQKKSIMATPAVKRLALDMNVDIYKVKGTGPNGKILEADVKAYASGSKSAAPKQESNAVVNAQQAQANQIQHAESADNYGPTKKVPLSFLRKVIAKNMEASSSIPVASHMDLIDSGNLVDIVERTKEGFTKDFGIKLTYLPFMIKAATVALKDNPYFNASYDPENKEVTLKQYYNIGLGAKTDEGLKIIVIKDADKKSILQIAKDLTDLREKLYSKTIQLNDMKGTSFTITNIGSLGGGYMGMPIINPPDVAILSFGIIKDTPVVKNGAVVPGKVMEFTLTFDHRVVDGAAAADFGNELKRLLENPYMLTLV